MWMSNTASAALMSPLAKAVISELRSANKHSEELISLLPHLAVAVDLGINII